MPLAFGQPASLRDRPASPPASSQASRSTPPSALVADPAVALCMTALAIQEGREPGTAKAAAPRRQSTNNASPAATTTAAGEYPDRPQLIRDLPNVLALPTAKDRRAVAKNSPPALPNRSDWSRVIPCLARIACTRFLIAVRIATGAAPGDATARERRAAPAAGVGVQCAKAKRARWDLRGGPPEPERTKGDTLPRSPRVPAGARPDDRQGAVTISLKPRPGEAARSSSITYAHQTVAGLAAPADVVDIDNSLT